MTQGDPTSVVEWKTEKLGEVSAVIYVDIHHYIQYSKSVLTGNVLHIPVCCNVLPLVFQGSRYYYKLNKDCFRTEFWVEWNPLSYWREKEENKQIWDKIVL